MAVFSGTSKDEAEHCGIDALANKTYQPAPIDPLWTKGYPLEELINPVTETLPLLDCIRCGNPLQFKEIKAQQHHCEPCKRLVEAAAHQEKLIGDIHRANKAGGL